MQLLVALPSTSTVHAPHSPVSQPTFVPVRPSRSRNVSTRSSLGVTSTETSLPLTVRELRTPEALSDTGEVVCDLAVAHHEAVVDLSLTGLLRVIVASRMIASSDSWNLSVDRSVKSPIMSR